MMNRALTLTFRSYMQVACLMGLLAAVACNYTLKVEDGPTAYQLNRFHDAIPMLESAYNKSKIKSEKGKIAYQLAESYRRTAQPESALRWYQNAYNNNYGSEALKGQAFALKQLERYPEAQEVFKNLGIEIGSPYEYRKEITACNTVAQWIKDAPFSGCTLTSARFNSPQNDFGPVWHPDGRLLFTSDRSNATGKERYRWTGQKFMDIWAVAPEAAIAQPFGEGWNTEAHEATPVFNRRTEEVLLVRNVGAYEGDHQYCKIMLLQGENAPQPLPFQKERINYLHPCWSADGQILYFSSNDPEGWGGYDIWSVQRIPNSETGWGEPKLLSRAINTSGNEVFPAMDADTLWFASDGHTGMGGLDLYRSYKLERNNWAPVYNPKSPMNSGADDFGIVFLPKPTQTGTKSGELLRSGFISSNRSHTDARGGDDIWAFEWRVPPPRPVPVVPPVVTQPQWKLEGYVVEKIFQTPDDPNSRVLGRRPLANATVTFEQGGKKQTLTTNAEGFFALTPEESTDYKFVGSKTDYFNNQTRFSTKGMVKSDQVFEVEIILEKIFREREITLDNIYYDYDKWDIRPDAEPTLNRLAETLQQNPGISIDLGSHTDCRGNDTYNQTLAQKRAESAVNYLIGKGIAPERLSATGYGEQNPAVICGCNQCSEDQHQANRRTTFKVK
jgi:peptidoglycan-associated lipoprotein